MSTKKRKSTSKRRKGDVGLHEIKGKIYSKTGQMAEGVYLLKNRTISSELFSQIRFTVSDPKILISIHGDPFPGALSGVHGRKAVVEHGSAANEIIWAISCLANYSDKLRSYNLVRERFECAVLRDDKINSMWSLREVCSDYGWSV